MKIFIFLLTLLSSISTNAQLTYLGDDAVNAADGYMGTKPAPGLVQLDGMYYFMTPNGKLYSTDGTKNNTKIVQQFPAQTGLAYLKATNKYVYYAFDASGSDRKALVRYHPSTGVKYITTNENRGSNLNLNSIVVTGQNFLADEVFVNFEKDAFLIRKFTKDVFYIYIINDFNDNPTANLVLSQKLVDSYITTPIGVNTELETYKTDVYCNGRERPTGVYQTTINVMKRSGNDASQYEFKNNYSTLKYGLFPYVRFLRTKDNLYSLYKKIDSISNKKTLMLFAFEDKQIKPTTKTINLTDESVDTQTMDGDIYISYKGTLLKYDEAEKTYVTVIAEKDPDSDWQNVSKNTRFLKVGDYFLYRRNNVLSIYNNVTKSTTSIKGAFAIADQLYFTLHSVEAYAGYNSFYFTKRIADKIEFVRYQPETNTETPIVFPDFKNEKFNSIKAIFKTDNRFIFLTAYQGKKNKPVYKMFMYTEDGPAIVSTKQPVSATDEKPEPKPTIATIDINKFDKKLFKEQLSTIVNDQSNRFANIIGDPIATDMAPKNKSLITLEGFNEGVVINYQKESKLLRYEATTPVIRGKAAAMAILDMLDKEVQTLIAGNSIVREIDVNVKTRKLINYLYAGDSKLLQLDLYTNSNVENAEEAGFTITIRADKKTP